MRGWNYSPKYLRLVAENYEEYLKYQCMNPPSPDVDLNPTRLRYDILGTKIDFDIALRMIGRGDWLGIELGDKWPDIDFKTYRSYGRLQQVVIADILGISDRELEQMGFYYIENLKGRAYGAMSAFLRGSSNRFVRKSLDKHGIIELENKKGRSFRGSMPKGIGLFYLSASLYRKEGQLGQE